MAYDLRDPERDIIKAIGELVATCTGMQVYEERTNFTKPSGEYLTIYINNMTSSGRDSFNFLGYDAEGKAVRAILYEIDCTVKAYRGSPKSRLLSLIQGLETPELYDPTYEAGVTALLGAGTITDASSVLDNLNWEPRAAIMLRFNSYITTTDPTATENVESVEIDTGKIYSPTEDDLVSEINTTVSYP